MNYHTLIEAHKGIVYLFLLIFTIKVLLLIFNKPLFEKVRAKTKITEMILGTLLVASGVWLLISLGGVPNWLITKIILVLIAIPIAIIGLRKGNVALALIALGIFVYIFFAARAKSLTLSEVPTTPVSQEAMVCSDHTNMIVFEKDDCNRIHQTVQRNNNPALALCKENNTAQNSFHENKRLVR